MSPILETGNFQTPHEVYKKYAEILVSNGISDPLSAVIVTDACLRGEGMTSQAFYVTVKFENVSIPPLNLFVKTISASPVHSGVLTEAKFFEKEGLFLTKYVEAAKEFCKSHGLNNFIDFYPKCYYGDDKMTVCENLVLDKGYTLLDKQEQQDLDAAELAMQNLAKHHAISYAMIKDAGGPEPFFQRYPNLDFEGLTGESIEEMFKPLMEKMIKLNIKLLEENNIEDKDAALNTFKDIVENIYDRVMECLKYNPDELLMLGHGDYWNNNMMFLKDNSNKTVSQVMIDLQITRYNSPAIDVGYYMYTSVKPQVRKEHLHKLLTLYLDTLKDISKKLSYPISMSYDEFYMLYRRKMKFGYWLGSSALNMAGFAAFKELDMGGMKDVSEWGLQFEAAVKKWIVENPDKSEQFARNCVLLDKEYKELVLE